MNQLARFNRVRYTLYSDLFAPLEIDEPEGWDDDQKELLRSEQYHGITRNFSNALRFYGKAFLALKSAYDIRGILANVRIEREERNENTDVWELVYDASFDFSTYQQDKNYISINLNESEFFKRIEANMKEKFELERLTDIKGRPIPSLNYNRVELEGREFFREAEFTQDNAFYQNLSVENFTVGIYWMPMEKIFSAITEIQNFLFQKNLSGELQPLSSLMQTNSYGNFAIDGELSKMFWYPSDTFFGGQARFVSSGSVTFQFQTGAVFTNIAVRLIKFNDGVAQSFVFNSGLLVLGSNNTIDLNFDVSVPIQENDTFAFYFLIGNGSPNNNCRYRVDFSNLQLKISNNTPPKVNNIDAITLFSAFDRILQIINGRRCFDSNLLNSQQWQWLMFTNGFKIRNIPEKPLTVSLEELWNCINTIDGVAMFIKKNRVSIEPIETAYNNQTIFDLGTPVEITRKIKPDLYFSSIEIGYDFNGEYENIMGLDEFNISNTYKTCIDTHEQEYKSISKVRADAYGVTLAQLKQYIDFPKEDTKYDKFNFLLDCKNIGKIVVRRWQDDFANEPTGIFSPQTAFNLRLSPFNCLLRKSKHLTAGLTKFPTELLTYASTEGNSQLVTVFPERANVANSVLGQPMYLAEEITFNLVTSLSKLKMISENKYNLIKFVNEFGDEEFAYFISVKPNKEGNYTMIKANI